VSLNNASYEELRELGLSVTQTGRVLSHRERTGGFKSLEELDQVPGFPRDFLEQFKGRIAL
jgi:competence ComEA-like helix-hairpin-helix protein